MTDADRYPSGATRPAGSFVALVVTLMVSWLGVAPAQAQFYGVPPYNQPLYVVPGYPPSSCYSEVRIFETLKYGPTTLCRQNMKYRPGSLECVQIVDQVCGSYQLNGQWIEGRSIATTNVVPCPQGPPQPMCPQLGGTGIRGRRSFIR